MNLQDLLAIALLLIPSLYAVGTFRLGIRLPKVEKMWWCCSHTVICGLVALAGWVIFPEMKTVWSITFSFGLVISAALLIILAKPLPTKP